jgi:hypothetical protein
MIVAYCAPYESLLKKKGLKEEIIGALISPGRNLGRCADIAKEATNAGDARITHSDDGRQA